MSKSSFVEFPDSNFDNDFAKPQYLKYVEGMPLIVRILDDRAYHVQKHWINSQRLSLLCLGGECPICERNAQIRKEFPKSYWNQRDYISRSNRYMVNVLDRTPVVVDEETGEEYYARQGNFPTVTSDGSRSLANLEPRPSNTIKILERGKTLFEQLKAYHEEFGEFDEDGNTVSGGLTTFDIKIITLGKGLDKVISPMPLPQNNYDVSEILDEIEQEKHDLSTLGILLSPDEVEKVAYRGVSLRDIFAERKAEEESEVASGTYSDDTFADAGERVAGLFDVDEDNDWDEEE
jgi:hypothetical protein